MEDRTGERTMRDLLEREELDVTENTPRILTVAVKLFMESLVKNSGIPPDELRPEDIGKVINRRADYKFLRTAVGDIVGK